MFGLNSVEVLKLIETWYSRKRSDIKEEISKQTVISISNSISSTVEAAVDRLFALEETLKKEAEEFAVSIKDAKEFFSNTTATITAAEDLIAYFKENTIEKQVEVAMSSWFTQIDKFNLQHKEAINSAVEKSHNDLILVVNGLLEKAALSLAEADKNNSKTKEYITDLRSLAKSLENIAEKRPSSDNKKKPSVYKKPRAGKNTKG